MSILSTLTLIAVTVLNFFLPSSYELTLPSAYLSDTIEIQEYGDTAQVTIKGKNTIRDDIVVPDRQQALPIRHDHWAPPHSSSISAESYIVMDRASGEILYSRNPNLLWPAASITKLMSTLVFVDYFEEKKLSWDIPITFYPDDFATGTSYLHFGEKIALRDIFKGTLIGSINSFAHVLVRVTDLSESDFVRYMNERARQFGLWSSSFDDPTGLSSRNIITAKETAWLLKEALAITDIQSALIEPSFSFTTIDTEREVHITNTNKLLLSDLTITGGKTGHIPESKYNFAVSIANDTNDEIIVVVLGSDSEEKRFEDAQTLALWAFDSYSWN